MVEFIYIPRCLYIPRRIYISPGGIYIHPAVFIYIPRCLYIFHRIYIYPAVFIYLLRHLYISRSIYISPAVFIYIPPCLLYVPRFTFINTTLCTNFGTNGAPISKHYIPEEWRIHLIIPIFKSGDRSAVKNYRPISLLCTISKVLERIVFAHIIDFVSNSISPMKFGFLQNHSTLQQLLVFLRDIYNSFTHNTPTDVLYLDFKKAFDSVSHNELLFKLWI